MDASNYQQLASRTLIDRPDFAIGDTDMMILWNALGLAGEAGEVAETVKKGVLHQHGLDAEKMKKELGDVLWYVAALCTKLDLDMGAVMFANIEKLKVRYPDGFKSTDSIARVDVSAADVEWGIKTAQELGVMAADDSQSQENAILSAFYQEVCDQAEKNMASTGTVSGAHWNAMRQVLAQRGIEVSR